MDPTVSPTAAARFPRGGRSERDTTWGGGCEGLAQIPVGEPGIGAGPQEEGSSHLLTGNMSSAQLLCFKEKGPPSDETEEA